MRRKLSQPCGAETQGDIILALGEILGQQPGEPAMRRLLAERGRQPEALRAHLSQRVHVVRVRKASCRRWH